MLTAECRVPSAECYKKLKGCDIGYGLATNSCEGVNSVDACTVTALDAITAFAVPDPNLLLAEPVGFFGFGSPANHFTGRDHPAYFGSATVYFGQPFQPSTKAIIIKDWQMSTPMICASKEKFRHHIMVCRHSKNAGAVRG
jgi:hypothetical protein